MRPFNWEEYERSVTSGKPLRCVNAKGEAVSQIVRFDVNPQVEPYRTYGIVNGEIESWEDDGIWSEPPIDPRRNLMFAD